MSRSHLDCIIFRYRIWYAEHDKNHHQDSRYIVMHHVAAPGLESLTTQRPKYLQKYFQESFVLPRKIESDKLHWTLLFACCWNRNDDNESWWINRHDSFKCNKNSSEMGARRKILSRLARFAIYIKNWNRKSFQPCETWLSKEIYASCSTNIDIFDWSRW